MQNFRKGDSQTLSHLFLPVNSIYLFIRYLTRQDVVGHENKIFMWHSNKPLEFWHSKKPTKKSPTNPIMICSIYSCYSWIKMCRFQNRTQSRSNSVGKYALGVGIKKAVVGVLVSQRNPFKQWGQWYKSASIILILSTTEKPTNWRAILELHGMAMCVKQ